MIRDDRIDVITISVKVPAHRELVLAALDAGKPVYCEAPLGRTVAEAEEMASAVGSLHTAIGLQGRLNPARAPHGPAAFFWKNWTATQRENCRQHQRLRAGIAFLVRLFQ